MLSVVYLVLTCALARPPDATLEALDGALGRLEDPAQVRSMVVTTRFEYAKLDGEDAHEDLVVTEVTRDENGVRTVRMIQHLRDGEPVEQAEKKRKDDDEGVSFDVALPIGDDLVRYRFGPTSVVDEVSVATFEPAERVRRKDLALGRIAWDPSTNQPLWLEFAPVKTPTFVQALDTRLELAGDEGSLHTHRILSRGVGGIPGMRRRFEMDLTIDQVGWVD
ncbi:MAG: hypothetical protein JRJ84_24575 [Deltaproteobacteria bacterium]|nr:hypothetical protein [Deltaproteobacteria bacterium]